jgi:hypothetical protein
MAAVHWFWADFMMSSAARNFFFAADQWDYSSNLGPWRYRFWNLDTDAAGRWSPTAFAAGLAVAMVLATVSSRIGLAWGKGMSKVKR